MKAGAMLNRYWAIIRRPTSRASRILSPVTVTMGFYVHIYVCVYIYILLSLSKWDEPPSRVAFFLHSNRDACTHCQESFMADVVYTFKQTKINHKQERPI